VSSFSLIERIALAASLLADPEKELFEDLFVNGLTQQEVCQSRQLSIEQFMQMHRSLMRSLCGITATSGSAQSGAPQGDPA